MPASSVSSSVSWGVYLVASLALVTALTPAIRGVSQFSQEAALGTVVQGVASVVNGLEPGMAASLVLQIPAANASVRLEGHTVVGTLGGIRISQPSSWALPNTTLSYGVVYTLTIEEGRVEVA